MTHPINCEKYKQSNPDTKCYCGDCLEKEKILEELSIKGRNSRKIAFDLALKKASELYKKYQTVTISNIKRNNEEIITVYAEGLLNNKLYENL